MKFLKEKGLYLVCVGLVLVAAVTGIMAVRNIVHNVSDLTALRQQALEEKLWNEPDTTVNNPVTDIPEPSSGSESNSSATASAPPLPSAVPSASPAPSGEPEDSSASSAPRDVLSASLWAGEPLQTFSGDELVYNETLADWRTHNGTDFSVSVGAEVPAIKDGTVLNVRQDALWGGVVEISDRNGRQWVYCGLKNMNVNVGDVVKAGTTLGVAGSIPCERSLGGHIHLECIREEKFLDPMREK